MSEREEKCAEQRKEGVQPRRLGLKWLKEGEWRREEGIVEFIAILRWPHTHEACIQTERIKLASFREKLPVQVRLHKMCTP